MPSFKLPLDRKNLEIAKALKEADDYVNVTAEGDSILISFDWGLNIIRLSLGTIGKDLTDTDWNNLLKQIKRTLKGAKVRDFNSELISIRPLRTEQLHLRVDPLEKNHIKEAAKIEGMTITDFMRVATLRVADEVHKKEKARKAYEEMQSGRERTNYVS